MNYETKLEQDRRVLRAMNSAHRHNVATRHATIDMADLILSGPAEHVTCWTDEYGRHQHSTIIDNEIGVHYTLEQDGDLFLVQS